MATASSRAEGYGHAISDESITDLSSSASLTVPAGATTAVVTARTNAVRYRYGTAPTAALGHFIAADGSVEIFSKTELASVEFIEVTASAQIFVTYFKD